MLLKIIDDKAPHFTTAISKQLPKNVYNYNMKQEGLTFSRINAVINWATEQLNSISHSPRLDAELLLAHVLEVDRSYFISHSEVELDTQQNTMYAELIKERVSGKPVAYILGRKGFWTFDLIVNKHTLVPRPETELLVEQALKLIPEQENQLIADLCTGSGAIALAIASERPLCQLHATDLDDHALNVARANAELLAFGNIEFYVGDLYDALPEPPQLYDMLLSNPPYIDENDVYLLHPTMQHEPRHALIAANNGLAIIENLIHEARTYLKDDGFLIIEHGHEQKSAIEELCKKHHLNYMLGCQDYQALDRISVIQK